MPLTFKRHPYSQLNSRQQEAYNFQKVSAVLADFGFVTIRLADDWCGADFIAQHLDGGFLKVQLKGRLTFDKKYRGKDLHICFLSERSWYLYPHDEVLDQVLADGQMKGTKSWDENGMYNFPSLSSRLKVLLEPYRIES